MSDPKNKPCTRDIEGVQCYFPCCAVRLVQPWQRVDDWGWCPECGKWSTASIALEYSLIGDDACFS